MLQAVIRFIVSAVVLLIVGYLVPGIQVAGIWGALAAALVIALMGYLIEKVLGDKVSPRSRGLVGFGIAAVVIYLAQFAIPTLLNVTILGALLAAFAIGLIDAFVPTELR
ncbi:MAG: phage holin family protein [Syntrophomonas sp.]|jgi:putative membrane protein|nr:phage holin family protein [Syntrophomonas sp.]